MASRYLDLDALADLASAAAKISVFKDGQENARTPSLDEKNPILNSHGRAPKIGIIKDSAFQFYYPENIEALAAQGAELVFTSPLCDTRLPDIDALYIGGGFPETHAAELAENTAYNDAIRSLATDGLPIYAECGGLMYLGEELVLEEKTYPMTGVLPVIFGFSKKPQGHGYTVIAVDKVNPYFAACRLKDPMKDPSIALLSFTLAALMRPKISIIPIITPRMERINPSSCRPGTDTFSQTSNIPEIDLNPTPRTSDMRASDATYMPTLNIGPFRGRARKMSFR